MTKAVGLHLIRILAISLEEGGDEIYFKIRGNGNNREIRPPGSPDYWRFDYPGIIYTMDIPVARLDDMHTVVDVRLMEQDNATLGNPHDEIGLISPLLDPATGLLFGNSQTATYLGRDDSGLHVVEFKKNARYKAWFRASETDSSDDALSIRDATDPERCAVVMNAAGNNLDLVEMSSGTEVFVRNYSPNSGSQWFYDATLTTENLLQPTNQIGQGVFTSEPAAAVSADGKQMHVFGRGNDNKIWRAFSPDGGTHWTYAWGPIGVGVFTSAPAAAVSADGKQLHVFGRGNDNKIWRAFSPDGGVNWTYAWGPIGAGVFTSSPAAVISADGRQVHVFGRGNDNKIWRAYSPDGGANWTYAWGPIGEGVFTSGPAAAISADGKQLHVFGRGMDNKIWRAFSPNGGANWTLAWAPITPQAKAIG